MRIAFFGGSFDPPHIGHLRIALAAARRLSLDRILLAPVAVQPLKREGASPAGYADRLAMLRLLIAEEAEVIRSLASIEVSELDAPRADGRPNYTYDTLRRLRAQYPSEEDNQLFLLLGADSFLSMRSWYRAGELLLLADWIVASRPGFSLDELDQALPLTIRVSGRAKPSDGYIAQELLSADGVATTLYLLPDLCEDVSATEIRAAIASGADAEPDTRQVLTPSIVAYIRRHGLYRPQGRARG